MTNSQQQRLLLTTVGINLPKLTTYQFTDGREVPGLYSFTSLWYLLPTEQRPDEIVVLMTTEAANQWPDIENEANRLGAKVRRVEIAGNELPNDSAVFLEKAAAEIPEHCQLILDVTQGLRHHAFLLYALALYLTTFRGVQVSGAWYCRWEISRDVSEPRPFINLKPVLDLAEWFHALAVFRATGSLKATSDLLPAGEIRNLTERLSAYFLIGMPIEAGDAASRLLVAAQDQPIASGLPLSDRLNFALLESVRPIAGNVYKKNKSEETPEKRALRLEYAEIERQAVFIKRYFETGQLNLAFGLMREWIVNWIALQRNLDDSWLEKSAREKVEHLLGGLDQVFRAKEVTDAKNKPYKHVTIRDGFSESQRVWAQRWGRICDVRNALQHHGMKPQPFDLNRDDITQSKVDFEARESWTSLDIYGGSKGRLLICPIGLTPGVLFSALKRTEPDRAIVICSTESEAAIDEACQRAEYTGELSKLVMQDIHRGITEFRKLEKAASLWLFQADEIRANLTGGTTLMGALVGRLINLARREYQRQLHEFLLIDPRHPEDQRNDPWHLGDIYYLDGDPDITPIAQGSDSENLAPQV